MDLDQSAYVDAPPFKKRAIVVSPTPTWPLTAGNRVRAWQTANALKLRGFEIHLVYFDQELPAGGRQLVEMQKQWDAVYVIPYRPDARKKLKDGEIWLIDDWYQDDIGHLLSRLTQSLKPDVLWFNYFWATKAIQYLPWKVTTVIDTHDRMSDRHLLLDRLGIKRNFFFCSQDDERRALSRGDVVIAIQDAEARFFTDLGVRSVHPVGFLPQQQRPMKKELRSNIPVVGYIASDNDLNKKFLGHFIDLLSSGPKPNFQVLVAGQICRSIGPLLGTASRDWLVSHGPVHSLDEFYDLVDLTVNPMFDGTGLKMKTLESLDFGTPVVGGAAAFEGIGDVTLGKCSTPASMVTTLRALTQPRNFSNLATRQARVFQAYCDLQESRLSEIFDAIEAGTPKFRNGRFLLVTDVDFWLSRYGSGARIREVILALSKAVNLTVFVFRTINAATQAKIRAEGVTCPVISYKEFEKSSGFVPVGKLAALPGCRPIVSWYDAFVNFLKQTEPFDGCVIEYHHLTYLVDALPPATARILDSHDLKFMREAELRRVGIEAPDALSEQDEFRIFKNFDLCLMISLAEQKYAARKGIETIFVPYLSPIRPGVRETLRNTGAESLPDPSFVLLGSAALPNISGFRWFLTYVWPALSTYGWKLRIIGNSGLHLTEHYPELCDGVECVGYVDDLSSHVNVGDILINPVHVGSGQKTKLIDGAALGAAIVTTPEGLYGLASAEKTGWMIASSAEEFFRQCVLLVNNPQTRLSCIEASLDWLAFVNEKYRNEDVLFQMARRASVSPRILSR